MLNKIVLALVQFSGEIWFAGKGDEASYIAFSISLLVFFLFFTPCSATYSSIMSKRLDWIFRQILCFETPGSPLSPWLMIAIIFLLQTISCSLNVYLSDMVTLVFVVHGRNTRSAANCHLYVPLCRHKEVYKQSFGYNGAITRNQKSESEIRNLFI